MQACDPLPCEQDPILLFRRAAAFSTLASKRAGFYRCDIVRFYASGAGDRAEADKAAVPHFDWNGESKFRVGVGNRDDVLCERAFKKKVELGRGWRAYG